MTALMEWQEEELRKAAKREAELVQQEAKTAERNKRLIAELEKRDAEVKERDAAVAERTQAVAEAVDMILRLEAENKQLQTEREMFRRIENDFHYSRNSTPTPAGNPSEPLRSESVFYMLSASEAEAEAKSMSRQPSFVLEPSAATETLRNVYIGMNGSTLSLSKTDGVEFGRAGPTSPSLSVLSESSFTSIYGQKNDQATEFDGSPRDEGYEFPDALAPRWQTVAPNPNKIVTPSKMAQWKQDNYLSKSTTQASKYHNINDMIAGVESPLQRMANMDKNKRGRNGASHPRSDEQLFDRRGSLAGRPSKQIPSQPKTKQEKREALEKVMTNGMNNNFGSSGLPPTPDTFSTESLGQYRSSGANLSKEHGLARTGSYQSNATASQVSLPDDTIRSSTMRTNGASLQATPPAAAPFSTTAFEDRLRDMPSSDHVDIDSRFGLGQIRRPRSADETTISNRARDVAQYMDSDSDDDSLDYWMKEAKKSVPAHGLNPGPLSSASQTGNINKGRVSPDLFSFPTNTDGWASNAMFGALGGSGYDGAAGGFTNSPLANTLDALGDSLPQPLFGSGLASPILGGIAAPPPPNRRSSLHARTGSSHDMVPVISAAPAKPSPPQTQSRTSRSPEKRRESGNSTEGPPVSVYNNARASAANMGRAPTAPPQHPMPVSDSQAPKQRHYPPTASQQARSRGLNSLFRRSTGSPADILPPPAAEQPPLKENTEPQPQPPQVGVPSWGKRNDLYADDRDSATPPPIMRSRRGSFDGGAQLDGAGASLEGGGAPLGPTPGHHLNELRQQDGKKSGRYSLGPLEGVPVKEQQGGKRKWLGLGSLRTRAGH